MWFGELPAKECVGCILAHSHRMANRRLPKGTVLDEGSLGELVASGFCKLTVARLEADDIEENSAALQLAEACSGLGTRSEKPHTGRVNIYAACDGLVSFNHESIVAANSVNQDITLSVVAENQWVLAGRMIASAKIIPYAVPASDLEKAVALIDKAELAVNQARSCAAVLIQTVLSSVKASTLDKTRTITEQRLQFRSATLAEEIRCEHTVKGVADALSQAAALSADVILIVGASAISDRRDVLPAAVEQCGGEVLRVGLPVDPGNLLMLAEYQGAPVMGLPGCARSPKHNGFDLLLDRIVCDLPITDTWMNRLCIGGLLGEVHDRPQPRVAVKATADAPAKVAALVLAAGSSRRAGETNKLLHSYNGRAMICSVVESVIESNVATGIVVTGHQQETIENILADLDIETHHCPNYTDGMAHSIAFGLSRLQSFDAVLVCLGDMPHISSAIINRIINATHSADNSVADKIVVPTYKGQRGNPVMIGRTFYDSVLRNEGDSGAKFLIKQYPEQVLEVEVDSDCVLRDYDTQEALQSLD